MEPQRDDWELTLREVKSQRLQHKVSLALLDASIKELEKRIKACPPKEVKDERKTRPAGVN